MDPLARWNLVLFGGLAMATACTSADDAAPDCEGDGCDTAGVVDAKPLARCTKAADFKTKDGKLDCTPCGELFADESGRGFVPAFIADDPLVARVYMTFDDANDNGTIDKSEIDCPVDMVSILAKLDQTDADGCLGVETRVVSETAAPLGRDKASYRAVTSRQCGDRKKFELLFSSFGFSGREQAKAQGLHITQDGAPGQVEIIAFDQSEGVFNFYKEVGGAMRFFGSSLDFVVGGPGGPSLTSTRGCANCHPGGGINQKELQSPWTHWSLNDNIDGADVLVSSRPYLGTLNAGADMEGIIRSGNSEWNATRASFLSGATTAELAAVRKKLADDPMNAAAKADLARRQLKKKLNATQLMLEPLFCSVQVNILAPGPFGVPAHLFNNVSGSFGLGPTINSSPVEFDPALDAIGSNVPGLPGVKDTTTPFIAIERSAEDEDYLRALRGLDVIDNQLIDDVEMVDFTRPVFSDDRCALLDLVPDLPPAQRKPAEIRDAILKAIKASKPAKGSAAAQLAGHLEASKAGAPLAHGATIGRYAQACAARPPADVVRDALKLRSLQRQLAYSSDGKLDDAAGVGLHPYAVFEFPQTMPVDKVTVAATAPADSVDKVALGARFDPNDCALINKYVAPAE